MDRARMLMLPLKVTNRAVRLDGGIEGTPEAVCPLGEDKGSPIVDEDRRSAIV
jgi:hypothetical protein